MSRLMSGQLESLRRQLDAAPWLKWALALIALLAVVSVGQALEGLRIAAQERAIDAEVELRRIKALQGQEEWVARAEASAQLRDALQAQIPPVATAGLAQASLQSWLNGLGSSAGDVQNLRVAVDNPAPLDAPVDVLRVRGTLSGGMPPRQALNIIRQIESATNLVSIESVDIRNDGNKVFSVSVNAYYRLATGEQGDAP